MVRTKAGIVDAVAEVLRSGAHQDIRDCRRSACGSRQVIPRGRAVALGFRNVPIGSRPTGVFPIPLRSRLMKLDLSRCSHDPS